MNLAVGSIRAAEPQTSDRLQQRIRDLERAADAVARLTPCTCSAQRARAERAEAERLSADNVIRATLAALGSGPDADPVIKAREVAAERDRLAARLDAVKTYVGAARQLRAILADTDEPKQWRDRHGDVWTDGGDGLMHTPETASFPREHVEKKWGPLVPLADTDEGKTDRPEIVCLCGSTRFRASFTGQNARLTAAGSIVLAPGVFAHDGDQMTDAEKVALDELHKRKIDLADRVLVLNVGGYIGSSTRGEIDYALAHGKPVDYIEPLADTDEPKAAER
jgi:hypothetical protein